MGVSTTGGGGGARKATRGRMAGLNGTQACLEMTGEWGRAFGILFFSRSKKVVGPSPAITLRRNTNITHFSFAAGQRGGNRARARCMRCM